MGGETRQERPFEVGWSGVEEEECADGGGGVVHIHALPRV